MAKKAIKRPLTVKQIQAAKKKEDDKGEVVIMNISGQLVPIHQRAPKGVDFYFGAEDIRLRPNERHTFKKSRLWMSQIDKLRKQRKIQIIYDSEVQSVKPR
jgi:hypothetical protein